MNSKEKLAYLKKDYEDIEIPKELDMCIQKSIKRGNRDMKKNKSNNIIITGVKVAASLAIIFTITVNTIPSFANSLTDLPVVGKLVQVLQFNKGDAQGGIITDGSDVSFISVKDEEKSADIVINFSKDGIPQDFSNFFDVKFTEYPYTMTFSVPGAREFSAKEDLEKLKESKFVEDAYQLMTMDDSMIRFAVTFNKPVTYEVKEYKDPGQVVVSLKEGEEPKVKEIYSIRSASYPYGEGIGMVEESVFGLDTLRVLKDTEGTYVVEAGYFNTEEEAKVKLEELKKDRGITDFTIEKRGLSDLPKAVKASE